jgi:hypothetical protein
MIVAIAIITPFWKKGKPHYQELALLQKSCDLRVLTFLWSGINVYLSFMKEAYMKKFSVLIGVVLIFLFLFPIISQAQDKYLVIPPSAIRPIDHYMVDLGWYANSWEFYFDSGFPDSVFGNAPVYLPHGATVTRMYVVYTDNGSGVDEEIAVHLRRQDFATGTMQTMAYVSSGSVAANPNRRHLRDDTINYATIDWKYSYDIQVRFYVAHPNVKFHGAVIIYEE